MSEFLQKEINIALSSNYFLQKKIDINSNLSCFILIDSKNEKILKPLLNKITDYLLDNLHSKDIYNSFLVSLESINVFLKNLEKKENSLDDLNIFIGVNYKKDFYFSKVGQASCYMVNSKNEFIELTENSKKDIFFDYISNGTLNINEKIIISNIVLNNYFTSEDIKDISLAGSLENTLEVMEKIIKEEEKEISVFLGVFSVGFGEQEELNQDKLNFDIKNIFYKIFDYSFFKKIYAYLSLLQDNFYTKSKNIKIAISFFGIVVSTFLLYNIISGIVGITIETNKKEDLKNQLIEAREYLRLANQNISNPDLFNINVEKIEEILSQIRLKNVYLTDIESISEDLSIIKKQFNGVEVFSMDSMKLLFGGDFSDAIKLLDINKKGYLVGKSSIFGPLISGQEIKHYIFSEIDIDDEFLDATAVGEIIILVTKKNRVVSYSIKDNTFKYITVIGQQTWQGSSIVESYNSNLYMLDSKQNQVYKHTPISGSYTSGVSYLNENDSNNIGKILSIGIDGGIYLLKDDLTIVKFFSSPYRLENIVLNKLPKNYTKENGKTPYLYVRSNLNLVYMLLNDKIFIFKPNTRSFRDTKSLTYLGQIEGKEQSILTFNVLRDGEIQVVSSKGIYKLNFEEKEDKIILR